MNERSISAFRTVPKTGVIYVTAEAAAQGFGDEGPDGEGWCNLGQGQPETGALKGAPARITQIPILEDDREYGPVGGLLELREAVAEMYNDLFRNGRGSKYTRDNVAIASGGRVALMRASAAIAPVHLGHFLPDYTAYTELLDMFRRFSPIPILLDPERGYDFGVDEFKREALGRGLSAFLLSNPVNPTGRLYRDETLSGWIDVARSIDCALIFDEFYSHYIWDKSPTIVSAAKFVDDVDRDPVVIIDGLTKNWRYPGLRVSWVVGPKTVIDSVTSAGSFMDGGCAKPVQRAVLPLVNRAHAEAETAAIHRTFVDKRTLLLDGLKSIGVRFDREPEATFYAWGDLSGLPEGLRDAHSFFQAALKEKVITVPGPFFDVDPGGRRKRRNSRFDQHMRFSFGPEREVLSEAIRRLQRMVHGS